VLAATRFHDDGICRRVGRLTPFAKEHKMQAKPCFRRGEPLDLTPI